MVGWGEKGSMKYLNEYISISYVDNALKLLVVLNVSGGMSDDLSSQVVVLTQIILFIIFYKNERKKNGHDRD